MHDNPPTRVRLASRLSAGPENGALDEMDDPDIGWSLWTLDPNHPDTYLPANVGGLVLRKWLEGDQWVYLCGRIVSGAVLQFVEFREGDWEFSQSHRDQAMAFNIYRMLCRGIGAARRANDVHWRDLERATAAASIALGRG